MNGEQQFINFLKTEHSSNASSLYIVFTETNLLGSHFDMIYLLFVQSNMITSFFTFDMACEFG